jgi:hypothetical protein
MTDDFQKLAEEYAARGVTAASSRLNLLMDIERIRDRRVLPFLLSVLRDCHESNAVRIYVLKQLRHGNGLLLPADRPPAADAIGDVLAGHSSEDVRVLAALALGVLTEQAGVLAKLGAICVAPDESIDLRYAAFTALQRAGPTSECVELLRGIASDETLGGPARNVLSAWNVA